MHLLEQKPLDKITVKDIVEDCGVNRGTFYYYYADIYALVEDIFEEEVQRIAASHTSYDSWQEGFLLGTEVAKKEKRQLYHAYNAINRDKLESYLTKLASRLMEDFVAQQAEGLCVPQEDQRFIARFYSCALVGLAMQWIRDGMVEDPEAYINRMGLLLEGNIRRALETAAKNHSDKS